MKRAMAVLGVAAMSLWATAISAQGRSFGGSWTVDSEKTMAAVTAAGGAGGGTITARTAGGGGRGGGVVAAGGEQRVAVAGGGGGGRGGGGGAMGVAGPMAITLDATSFSDGRNTYKVGGTSTYESPRGTVTAKTSWVSDKLVIEATSQGPNGPIVTKTSWYLEGESLVRETSTPVEGAADRVSKTYYKRS